MRKTPQRCVFELCFCILLFLIVFYATSNFKMLQFCIFLKKVASLNERNLFLCLITMKPSMINEWTRKLEEMEDVVIKVTVVPWIKTTQFFRAMPASSGSTYIRNVEYNLVVFCKKQSVTPGEVKQYYNEYFPFSECEYLNHTERFTLHRFRQESFEVPYLESKTKISWAPEQNQNNSEKPLAYGQFLVHFFPV